VINLPINAAGYSGFYPQKWPIEIHFAFRERLLSWGVEAKKYRIILLKRKGTTQRSFPTKLAITGNTY
jgi:hypothetical protein